MNLIVIIAAAIVAYLVYNLTYRRGKATNWIYTGVAFVVVLLFGDMIFDKIFQGTDEAVAAVSNVTGFGGNSADVYAQTPTGIIKDGGLPGTPGSGNGGRVQVFQGNCDTIRPSQMAEIMSEFGQQYAPFHTGQVESAHLLRPNMYPAVAVIENNSAVSVQQDAMVFDIPFFNVESASAAEKTEHLKAIFQAVKGCGETDSGKWEASTASTLFAAQAFPNGTTLLPWAVAVRISWDATVSGNIQLTHVADGDVLNITLDPENPCKHVTVLLRNVSEEPGLDHNGHLVLFPNFASGTEGFSLVTTGVTDPNSALQIERYGYNLGNSGYEFFYPSIVKTNNGTFARMRNV